MKLPLETIIKSGLIISQITPDDISVDLYYRLCKISRKFQAVSETYEQVRSGLAVKYAKKDSDGKPVVVKDRYLFEDEDKFKQELNTLLTTVEEVDIELIPNKYLSELKLPVGSMAWILDLVEQEEQ